MSKKIVVGSVVTTLLAILALAVVSTVGCNSSQVASDIGSHVGPVSVNIDPSTGTGTVSVTIKEDQDIIDAVLANGDSPDTAQGVKGGEDRAVVFGDNFPGTSAELHECVNDARKNVLNLVRFDHFPTANIRLFLNEKCTKANYERWSTWAVANAKPGDRRIALMNSSHGAEDTDASGAVTDVIVTWDMVSQNRWDATTEVSAEFWQNLLRSTTVDFLVLNDCCHAGGDMRAAVSIQAAKSHKAVRSIDGPAPVKARIDSAVKHVSERTELAKLTGTVIPACQASELSEEASGFGGAATEAFWRARKTIPATGTVADIIREANKVLKANGFSQHMGLVGVNKVLFSAN